jgi:predicted enzyme related to lactoylglutathione lyase
MTSGVKTIVVPVKDLAAAKALYSRLLGTEPYLDAPYYVGFRAAGQELGLDPNGHQHGATAYWTVDDIKASVADLLGAGAQEVEAVKDVGGGRLIATLRDADGNIIGLSQDA